MPTSKSPVESHVQAVVSCSRSSARLARACRRTRRPRRRRRRRPTSVEIQPAVRRVIDSPMTVIAKAPASGAKRQIQAPAIMPAPEHPEGVDVERQLAPAHRDDQPEADDDLGGGDGHHGEREDLAVDAAVQARERDQGEVRGVEHDLEREQHDQRAAPQEHARRADREEDRGDDEVPGDVRAVTSAPGHRAPCSARVCVPRTTPPTAATSSTIEVISNASRWSVRKMRPISAGQPNESLDLGGARERVAGREPDRDDDLDEDRRPPRRPRRSTPTTARRRTARRPCRRGRRSRTGT